MLQMLHTHTPRCFLLFDPLVGLLGSFVGQFAALRDLLTQRTGEDQVSQVYWLLPTSHEVTEMIWNDFGCDKLVSLRRSKNLLQHLSKVYNDVGRCRLNCACNSCKTASLLLLLCDGHSPLPSCPLHDSLFVAIMRLIIVTAIMFCIFERWCPRIKPLYCPTFTELDLLEESSRQKIRSECVHVYCAGSPKYSSKLCSSFVQAWWISRG